ncbi:uncharacterized protein [Dermacentor albipictus]|uniref:uncharacterized protein n=1 Tax=Dermacentor albipictus TaxID=60249 RepID=UPI0031FC5569
MCLCESPDTVILLGCCCFALNVATIINTCLTPMAKELDPTLRTVYRVVDISYDAASSLLSVGLAWGAYRVNRPLLEKVVLGTKIRLVVLAILLGFQMYILSQKEHLTLYPGLSETMTFKYRRVGNDSWSMSQYKSLDPGTIVQGPNLPLLALKNPAGKDKHKKPKKKGELDEEIEKRIEKIAALTIIATEWIIVLFVEMFIVYRLGLFVDNLPT